MQQLHFGKIEGLVIMAREPCFTPAPTVTQEIKLGAEAVERPACGRDDFPLKRHLVELFDQFDHLPDGAVVAIEVRHGLPARLIVARGV